MDLIYGVDVKELALLKPTMAEKRTEAQGLTGLKKLQERY